MHNQSRLAQMADLSFDINFLSAYLLWEHLKIIPWMGHNDKIRNFGIPGLCLIYFDHCPSFDAFTCIASLGPNKNTEKACP